MSTVLLNNHSIVLHGDDDGIAVLSFRTKMNSIDAGVLASVREAVAMAQDTCRALVIAQTNPPFSVGADLRKVQLDLDSGAADMQRALDDIDVFVRDFQTCTGALKLSKIPVIAAIDGLALGGGCEFLMHCTRAVATRSSRIGLVESGVGLLPAGGGCKELIVRAAGDHDRFVEFFSVVATGQLSTDAEHARTLGYLRDDDKIVEDASVLLATARRVARDLADSGCSESSTVGQSQEIATIPSDVFAARIEAMSRTGELAGHDLKVAQLIALVFSGGGKPADEAALLDLERTAFLSLVQDRLTQARIAHTLASGKRLRN